MNRLELIIDEREDRQQAFRYYSALHDLSISKSKREVHLLLADNKIRFQDMMNECENEITLRWLQGALQIIDDLLDKIEHAGEMLNDLRQRM
ncbi:MAG: hypothetical protein ACYSU6_01350 [Planctomycetota bacterium]|jgi:hypothetical protein